MSTVTIGLLIFGLMILLILVGLPVWASMFFPSVLGLYILGGEVMTISQFMSGPINLCADYTYAVIPLFVIVGTLAGDTGIASNAFSSMKTLLSRRKGGLLYATIGANAVFGACCGVSRASNVVFAKICYPELKKAGYDEQLSLGCITASGTMTVLIPPSVAIIILCMVASLPIGTALVYGTATGILTTILMFAVIKIELLRHPEKAPEVTEADRSITWREKLKSLRLLVPIVLLFALIVGGSFLGWFPATIGGAIAVVAILVYAFAIRMPIKAILHSVWDGVILNAGVFLMVIAGQMFSRVIALSGLAATVSTLISSLNVPTFVIFTLIIVFYLICGCLMDTMSIILITGPVLFPVLTQLGFDPFIICMVMVFLCEIGALTPPVGMGVFTVAGCLKISATEVFKGIMPFFLLFLAIIYLIAFVPGIISWVAV